MTTNQTAVDALIQCIQPPNWTPATFGDTLWAQTLASMMVTANVIVNESTGTADHVNRLRWAYRMLSEGLSYVMAYTYLVVADATIQSNGVGASTDAQVQTAFDARVTDIVDSFPAAL